MYKQTHTHTDTLTYSLSPIDRLKTKQHQTDNLNSNNQKCRKHGKKDAGNCQHTHSHTHGSRGAKARTLCRH